MKQLRENNGCKEQLEIFFCFWEAIEKLDVTFAFVCYQNKHNSLGQLDVTVLTINALHSSSSHD